MGMFSNQPDPNIAAILAQLGVDNPSTADQTSVMNFLKVINDQIGIDNPTAQDRTTVMNYLKWLEYLIGLVPTGVVASTTTRKTRSTTVSCPASYLTKIAEFIPPAGGTVRLDVVLTPSTSNYTGGSPFIVAKKVADAAVKYRVPQLRSSTSDEGYSINENMFGSAIGTLFYIADYGNELEANGYFWKELWKGNTVTVNTTKTWSTIIEVAANEPVIILAKGDGVGGRAFTVNFKFNTTTDTTGYML